VATQPNERQIDVVLLHMDPENPRHESIDNEPQIIAALYKKGVPELARHIAENGLSPLERLAVLRHDKVAKHFVALEGNRRVCALKLLRDPSKAPHAAGRKLMAELKANAMAVPDKVTGVEFATREAADLWLSVKHEGAQGGIGTMEWGPDDKARFNKRSGSKPNPNLQALALCDYATAQGLIAVEDRAAIKLSTLTRYLTNKLMREVLGLVNKVDNTIRVDQAEFDLALQRFLTDSLPSAVAGQTARVNSRSSLVEREAYARDFRTQGFAPTTVVDAPVAPTPRGQAQPASKQAPARRNARDRDSRPYVIPSDFKHASKDPVLNRLIAELRAIKPDICPFACNYLKRAVIERAAILYAQKHGGVMISHNLHATLNACTDRLVADGTATANQMKPLRVVAQQENHPTSIQTLGAGVHGGVIPQAADLKRGWDSIQTGLALLITGGL